jgi:hypothetical protein
MNDKVDSTMRSPAAVVGGAILLVVAIVIGLQGLSWALTDPCAGVEGCVAWVDMRPAGWMFVGFALMLGVPGACLARWGWRSDPPSSR